MKTIVLLTLVICLAPLVSKSQSTIEFESGTTIEVTSGADICADNVIINGSYSGTGTQCGGALPVELATMTAVASARDVTVTWKTATEVDSYGFELERRMVSSFTPQVLNHETSNLIPTKAGTETSWSKIGFVEGSGTSTLPKEYSFSDRSLPPGRYAYRIRNIDQNGSFTYTDAIEVEVGLAPKEFTLGQNYPNPFNPTTNIEFTLPSDGHVLMKVYDIGGREVATLINEERKAGFYHQVRFDASKLVTGAYFFRIEFGGRQLTRKILLVK